MKTLPTPLFFCIAFAIFTPASSHAALVAQDEYNGSYTGFTNQFDPATPNPTGLVYSPLTVAGGSIDIGGYQGSFRNLDTTAQTFTTSSSDYYISYLNNNQGGAGNRIGLTLLGTDSVGSGREIAEIGQQDGFAGILTGQDQTTGNQFQNISSTQAISSGTNFFVIKISSTDNTISLFYNPTPGASMPTASLVWNYSTNYSGSGDGDFSLTAIRGFTASTSTFDEIRIGTTYADVTPIPEPSTWALLIGSLVSLQMLRGRRERSI